MSPQFSEGSYVHPRVLGEDSTSLLDVINGRPSDQGVLIPVLTKLEHVAHPVSEEDKQVVKRSRGEGDEVMDVSEDGIVGLNQGSALVADTTRKVYDERTGSVKDGDEYTKPSFKDMLTGRRFESPNTHVIPDLDVEINDKDSVIVRLLGRSIGYTALLNRVRALWNQCGADGGSWLIYGNYLTVQPWSRDFSTDKNHPDKIVVWVRLLGLSYRYYTKSMFRCIVGVIGQIVKIDYNTSEGKRGRFPRLAVVVDLNKPLVPSVINDGFRQQVEYEGLPLICYNCGCYGHSVEVCTVNKNNLGVDVRVKPSVSNKADSMEKYGPWMMASGRKARKASRGMNVDDSVAGVSQKTMVGTGKFDVLSQLAADVDGVEGTVDPPTLSDIVQEGNTHSLGLMCQRKM
ncbi:hypothetical protein GQ457_11G021930 [Hibiscus cannabinus]